MFSILESVIKTLFAKFKISSEQEKVGEGCRSHPHAQTVGGACWEPLGRTTYGVNGGC